MNPSNSTTNTVRAEKKKSSFSCDYFTYPKDAFTEYIEQQIVKSCYFQCFSTEFTFNHVYLAGEEPAQDFVFVKYLDGDDGIEGTVDITRQRLYQKRIQEKLLQFKLLINIIHCVYKSNYDNIKHILSGNSIDAFLKLDPQTMSPEDKVSFNSFKLICEKGLELFLKNIMVAHKAFFAQDIFVKNVILTEDQITTDDKGEVSLKSGSLSFKCDDDFMKQYDLKTDSQAFDVVQQKYNELGLILCSASHYAAFIKTLNLGGVNFFPKKDLDKCLQNKKLVLKMGFLMFYIQMRQQELNNSHERIKNSLIITELIITQIKDSLIKEFFDQARSNPRINKVTETIISSVIMNVLGNLTQLKGFDMFKLQSIFATVLTDIQKSTSELTSQDKKSIVKICMRLLKIVLNSKYLFSKSFFTTVFMKMGKQSNIRQAHYDANNKNNEDKGDAQNDKVSTISFEDVQSLLKCIVRNDRGDDLFFVKEAELTLRIIELKQRFGASRIIQVIKDLDGFFNVIIPKRTRIIAKSVADMLNPAQRKHLQNLMEKDAETMEMIGLVDGIFQKYNFNFASIQQNLGMAQISAAYQLARKFNLGEGSMFSMKGQYKNAYKTLRDFATLPERYYQQIQETITNVVDGCDIEGVLSNLVKYI